MSNQTYFARFQFWGYRALLASLAVFFLPSTARPQLFLPGQSQTGTAPPSAYQRKINTAMELAHSAATHGQLDVSLEAVRRALRNGPPLGTARIGGLLGGNRAPPGRILPSTTARTLGRTSTSTFTTPTSQELLSQRLLALDEIWEAQAADPEKCYQLWTAITFPKNQPNRIVVYASAKRVLSQNLSLEPKRPAATEETGVSKLIKWAKRSNNLDKLKDTVRLRLESLPGDSDAAFVQLKIAEADDNCDHEALLARIKEHASSFYLDSDPEPRLESLVKLIQAVDYRSPARREVMENLAATAGLSPRNGRVSWLTYCLLSEAGEALRRADKDVLNRMIDGSIRSYHTSKNLQGIRRSAEATLYDASMHNAFAAGNVEVALFCLTREQTLSTGHSERTLGDSRDLLAVASRTFQSLFAMPISDRYDLLNKYVWTLPNFGLENLSTFAPTEEIPHRFIEAYKRKRGVDQLPIESAVGLSGRSLSLIEWHMRDAIALGRTKELERRIQEMVDKGWKGANLLNAIYQSAQNRRIDVQPIVAGKGPHRGILPLLNNSFGVILPLHLDIIRSASADEKSRPLAIDFAERVTSRGLQIRNNIVLHGRHAVAECKLSEPKPALQADALRHFAQFDDFRYGTMTRGSPLRGIWSETEAGDWEHQACNTRSTLLLKYPLTGKFQVQFDCKDGPYASCGATAMGILYDFKGYARTISMDTIGLRNNDSRSAIGVSGTKPFSVKLDCDTEAGVLEMSTGERSLGKYYVPSGHFPFVGPQSMMHRRMALKNYRVEGDYTIPRSVDLVTPDLWGWSNLFLARSLPETHDYVRIETSVKGNASAAQASGPASVAFDWHVVDGVIESVDHKARYEEDLAAGRRSKLREFRPDEEWLYYSRQLCDQETVAFEFYQEAGKFSLYPTVDRVAFKLGNTPQEHWITSDESLFGLKGDDYFDISADRIIEKVHPIEKQWNQLELRRDGQWVTISLNGKPACRTEVDANYDGRFGFLCVPKQFHVRVRAANLSGPWPEKLPENLFETHESGR